jgi:hypothetical protein
MLKIRNLAWQARAIWKLLASMSKDEWTLDDYPIRVWSQQVTEPLPASRLKPIPWTAGVINWPAMSGGGNTRLEALEEVRKNFDRFKATGKKLPRPGTKVPIEFAAGDRVSRHPELEKEFIRQVLEINWAWISDESCLGDFHDEETDERLMDRIRRIYGVDVSDIAGGNLADIFDRIAKHKVTEDLSR